MKPAHFNYRRFEDLSALLSVKAQTGTDGQILAGGQSLVPLMNLRQIRPSMLLDIHSLGALRSIKSIDKTIIIGAATTFRELQTWQPLSRLSPLLFRAIPHVGYPAIRNRGTIGGSLAHADPAAELSACMLALDAVVTLSSKDGERLLRVAEFFHGASKTAIAPDEVLTQIHVPHATSQSLCAFAEISRRSMDISICGVAVMATGNRPRLSGLRIALMGISDRPILAKKTASFIEQCDGDTSTEELRHAIADEIEVIGDHRCDAATRLHFASVLIPRALNQIKYEST
jgi:aerobic carbon-monoxide dehydrogenase medium subunit